VTNKDKCKEIMQKLFGPATANLVDTMDENTCVQQCRQKVTALLGAEKAKEFDNI
jgi:predicted nucleic acid-binding Zn ribbon protein